MEDTEKKNYVSALKRKLPRTHKNETKTNKKKKKEKENPISGMAGNGHRELNEGKSSPYAKPLLRGQCFSHAGSLPALSANKDRQELVPPERASTPRTYLR